MDNLMLIGRGLNGWNASGLTSEGGSLSSSGGSLESYLLEAQDGTMVYDAVQAPFESFATWVTTGPLVGYSLKPGEIKRFGDKETLANMLPALGGAFQSFGQLAMLELDGDNGIGMMDYVALDLWLDMFRARVPNVKFGRVVNHQIVWESHSVAN